MLEPLSKLSRYIAISRHATENRQSVYAFVSNTIRPGDALQVFAFEDDYSFGVLHSTHHRRWFEERCTRLGRVALRYVSEDVWDTFPWPQAPTDETAGAVVDVVVRLLALRDEHLAAGTTLARQYASLSDPGPNPLRDLQEELDAAVAAAYGFTQDEDPLSQLFALNASIAAEERQGLTAPRPPGNLGLSDTMRTTTMLESPVRLGAMPHRVDPGLTAGPTLDA
jgi:hypothetical protein